MFSYTVLGKNIWVISHVREEAFQSYLRIKIFVKLKLKKLIDVTEKHKAYMKEYEKKKRADAESRKRKNENVECWNYWEEKIRAVRRCKMANPEQIREIDKQSKRKQKAEKPEHIKEIAKQSFTKRKTHTR